MPSAAGMRDEDRILVRSTQAGVLLPFFPMITTLARRQLSSSTESIVALKQKPTQLEAGSGRGKDPRPPRAAPRPIASNPARSSRSNRSSSRSCRSRWCRAIQARRGPQRNGPASVSSAGPATCSSCASRPLNPHPSCRRRRAAPTQWRLQQTRHELDFPQRPCSTNPPQPQYQPPRPHPSWRRHETLSFQSKTTSRAACSFSDESTQRRRLMADD